MAKPWKQHQPRRWCTFMPVWVTYLSKINVLCNLPLLVCIWLWEKGGLWFGRWLKILRRSLKQKTNLCSCFDVGCVEWSVWDIFRLRPDVQENLHMFSGFNHMWRAQIVWDLLKRIQKWDKSDWIKPWKKTLLKDTRSDIYC